MTTRWIQKPRDILQTKLHAAIDDYRVRSFETFALEISVYPTTDAVALQDRDFNTIGFDQYVLEVFGQEGRAFHVRLNHKASIRIWWHGHWTRVQTYLRHLQPTFDHNNPRNFAEGDVKYARWNQQSKWWAANGKAFRLLDLPPELRDTIYGFVFGQKIEPYLSHKARRLGWSASLMPDHKTKLALLKTCCQVYNEASNVLFVHTPFLIKHYGVLRTLLQNGEQRNRIKRLELHLSHDDYFRLFGGLPDQLTAMTSSSSTAIDLAEMKLNKLEMNMAPPSVNSINEWLDGACQKTIVDLICAHGLRFVRYHPVKLIGFVKTKQKLALERAAGKEKAKFDDWQYWFTAASGREGTRHEYIREEIKSERSEGGAPVSECDGEQADLFQPSRVHVTNATPLCVCKVPCTVEKWDPDA